VQCINSLPRISDTTDSLYRRFLIVPFDKTFVGVERKYIKSDYLHRQDVLQYVLYKVLNTDYYTFSEPDACLSMLDEYKEFNDPVRSFWNDVKDELVWDFYPNEFLLDLFNAWSSRTKMGTQVGRQTFLNNLELIAGEDGWFRQKGKTKITSARNGKPELLIQEYNLTEWRAKSYIGRNTSMICMPDWKESYYGFLRK